MSIPRFLLISSLIYLLLVFLDWLAGGYFWADRYSFEAMWVATSMSFFTGTIAYIITYVGLERSTRQFMAFLFLGMFSKMLLGLMVVILVAIEFKAVVKEYVVVYLISYFVFTAFEVYGLMSKLRA